MQEILLSVLQIVRSNCVRCIDYKKLIDYSGSLEKLSEIKTDDIIMAIGCTKKSAENILESFSRIDRKTRDLYKRIYNNGYKLYFYGNQEYPEQLSHIVDPPIILMSDGDISKADRYSVAVIGTRKASEYGKAVTCRIAEMLAKRNITVVSGCALGIDSYANQAALEAGGRTLAVLGSGLDNRYPKKNIHLMSRIADEGAVLSEFMPDEKPLPQNFPRRNRIISGLSIAVVVVEAPERSGALITADFALEEGRDVFAVPGNILNGKSDGCNNLISQGAIPVVNEQEIIEHLNPMISKNL